MSAPDSDSGPAAPRSGALDVESFHGRAEKAAGHRAETRLPVWAIPVWLVLLVLALYGRSVTFGTLDFDDGEYVFANPNVLAGLNAAGIRWAFTAFHSANWHPLTWISHMLDVQLFGPSPGAHHLVNAVLHAANAVILFLVLRAATSAMWPSAIVAALFAIHPLNVESVAWISQRKSVLSTLFLFLSIGAYVRWTRKRGSGRALLVLLLLALGLLAKPMLVTAPLLFLLLDFWPLRRGSSGTQTRALLLEKVPLFLLVAAASAATFLAQSKDNAVAEIARFPIATRVSNALVSGVLYLRDAIWPARLACFYPHPATIGESVGVLPTLGAAALLVAITAVAVSTRHTRPWILFGWPWYLVALVPVIGLVQVGSQARADRYAYVPMIGIFVAIVWEISNRVRASGLPRRAAAWAGAVVVAIFATLAFAQVGYWRDGGTLYTHALQVTRKNWLASNNIGNFWLSRGDAQRALTEFREAIRIKPDYEQAYYNEGVALMNLGRPLEAIGSYRRNLRLDPSNTDGWVNLGFTLLNIGRVPEALQAYETAVSQRPQEPLALYGAAVARAGIGDSVAAFEYLERLRRVDPARASRLEAELRFRR